MPVKFYMDVHIPFAVAEQLRIRGVDVLTATEEGTNTLEDDELLELASSTNRMVMTFDEGFRLMAEDWQREGRAFCGLAFARQLSIPIGRLIHDLEIIAGASEPEDWKNIVARLPLP